MISINYVQYKLSLVIKDLVLKLNFCNIFKIQDLGKKCLLLYFDGEKVQIRRGILRPCDKFPLKTFDIQNS